MLLVLVLVLCMFIVWLFVLCRVSVMLLFGVKLVLCILMVLLLCGWLLVMDSCGVLIIGFCRLWLLGRWVLCR